MTAYETRRTLPWTIRKRKGSRKEKEVKAAIAVGKRSINAAIESIEASHVHGTVGSFQHSPDYFQSYPLAINLSLVRRDINLDYFQPQAWIWRYIPL